VDQVSVSLSLTLEDGHFIHVWHMLTHRDTAEPWRSSAFWTHLVRKRVVTCVETHCLSPSTKMRQKFHLAPCPISVTAAAWFTLPTDKSLQVVSAWRRHFCLMVTARNRSVIKPPLAIARLRLYVSLLSVCPSVCLSVAKIRTQNVIFSKTEI